jgi:hypothetical protein
MGKFISYKDVPVFANFRTQNVASIETATSNFLFAASDVSINLNPNLTANRYLGKVQNKSDFSVTGPLEAKIGITFFPIVEKATPTSTLNISTENQLAFFNMTGNFSLGHSLKISNYFFKRTYLQNYSLKINPFQPVSVTANFISYDVSSVSNVELAATDPSTYLPIAKDSSKPYYKVLHGLSSIMYGDSANIPETKTNIEINVDCQRTPIYPIGSIVPSDVVLITAERTTTIQGEGVGRAVNISGAEAGRTDVFLSVFDEAGGSASSLNYILKFDINGRVVSQDISASQGNMVNGRVVIKEILL